MGDITHLAGLATEQEPEVAPAPLTIHRLFAEPIDNPRGPDVLEFDVTGYDYNDVGNAEFIRFDEVGNPNPDSIHTSFRIDYLLSVIAKLNPAAIVGAAERLDD